MTNPAKEALMQDVQEACEARRERAQFRHNLFGPTVKKSDFLKSTAIPTGMSRANDPYAKPPSPIMNVNRAYPDPHQRTRAELRDAYEQLAAFVSGFKDDHD